MKEWQRAEDLPGDFELLILLLLICAGIVVMGGYGAIKEVYRGIKSGLKARE